MCASTNENHVGLNVNRWLRNRAVREWVRDAVLVLILVVAPLVDIALIPNAWEPSVTWMALGLAGVSVYCATRWVRTRYYMPGC